MKIGYAIIIRWINYLMILLFELFGTSPKNAHFWIIFVLAWSILVIAESYRLLSCYSLKTDLILISLALIAGSLLSFLASLGYIYFFCLTWDIVFYFYNKKMKWLIAGIFFLCTIAFILEKASMQEIVTIEFWLEYGVFFIPLLLGLMINFLIAYDSKKQIIKRREVQKLNQQIEKLTIEKERNRMAQEIHDSLGHSLAGLIMHLEFLEKIIIKDPKKAKSLLIKMQNLARQGMQEVRLAVKTLRDEDYQGFKKTLERLCENLEITNDLNIDLQLDSEVENFSPKLKSIIYRNIQEAMTNSIKHGQSTNILLRVSERQSEVFCEIRDNGKGCNDLIKGNGFKGMEDRLQGVDGLMFWTSELDKGFTLRFVVPWEGGKI